MLNSTLRAGVVIRLAQVGLDDSSPPSAAGCQRPLVSLANARSLSSSAIGSSAGAICRAEENQKSIPHWPWVVEVAGHEGSQTLEAHRGDHILIELHL